MMQLPPIPSTQDKRTRDWMTSVSSAFSKLLSGPDRVATVRELVEAGIATESGGGVLAPGSGVSVTTVPAAITGLAAVGAMDNIYLSWDAPAFTNFAYTEVWRASTNDLGAAAKVGTTQAAVYVDAVGSGDTRYYWVRAVSTSNVIGPFNGSAGTRGQTGRDPSYVMSLLTGQTWEANTIYDSFQYVRPTTPNGFQYLCVTGGTSAAVEPVWPTTPGATISDNTVTWRCQEATIRVPFVIGTIDGQPAVAMSGAFIEDATILSAKIHSLAADKITAGQLVSGEYIQVGGSIWAGYNGYRAESYGGPAGFWMGIHGGVPRFQMTTAGDPPTESTPATYRRFDFNGYTFNLFNVDFISSADGEFDDLSVDTLSAVRVGGDMASFAEYVVPTDFNTFSTDDPTYYLYLAYDAEVRKTVTESLYGKVGNGASPLRGPLIITTDANDTILPFNESSSSRYHFATESIAFAIRVDSGRADGFSGGPYPAYPNNHYLKVELIDASDAVRFEITFDLVAVSGTQTGTGMDGPVTVECSQSADSDAQYALIVCNDDDGNIGYLNGTRLRARVSYKYGPAWAPSADGDIYSTVVVDFQMVSIPRVRFTTDEPLTV